LGKAGVRKGVKGAEKVVLALRARKKGREVCEKGVRIVFFAFLSY
jgi:hypothetical protein